MKFSRQFIFILSLVQLLVIIHPAIAQKKGRKKVVKATATKQQDTVIQPQKKRDTVFIYIDNKSKEKDKKTSVMDMLPMRSTDTVVIATTPAKKKNNTPAKDTMQKKVAVVEKVNPECQCVQFEVNTPDTLLYNNYINYAFSFKNNCRETIWINSGYFRYMVFTPAGKPVKVLRKLQYVKHYKYPEFVPVKPGASFDFRFGDDPFFEFDLRKGWKYKFTFIYNNKSSKHKFGRTYLCTEFKDRIINVK